MLLYAGGLFSHIRFTLQANSSIANFNCSIFVQMKARIKIGIGIVIFLIALLLSMQYMYTDSDFLNYFIVGIYILSLIFVGAGLWDVLKRLQNKE